MIRRCLAKDIPALQHLFATVYEANPRLQERDHIEWQFRDSPLNKSGKYTLFLSWEGSTINGFVGYTPVQLWHDDRYIDGCWVEKWYANSGAVGIQLLGRVMSLYDHRLIAGITLVARRVYEQYRIPILDEMPRCFGIIDPAMCATRFDIRDDESLERLSASSTIINRHGDASGIEHHRRFDPDADFRFDAWSSVTQYVRRTGAYLNWRYFDIPRHDYEAISDGRGQFAVYRIERIKGFEESVVRILEWNFTAGWAERAIAAILQVGKRSGAILIDFFCTAEEILTELEGLGFARSNSFKNSTIPYLFRPIFHTEGIRLAVDLPPHRRPRDGAFDSWYITKGDTDIDRIKI